MFVVVVCCSEKERKTTAIAVGLPKKERDALARVRILGIIRGKGKNREEMNKISHNES